MSTVQLSERLENLAREFDKNRRLFDPARKPEEEEESRRKFVERFPIGTIPWIKLDQYVMGRPDPESGGVNRDTFCYGLEHGTAGYGTIGGSSAKKFGIYYSKRDGEYKYDRTLFGSSEEAYDHVTRSIGTLLTAVMVYEKDGDVEALSAAFEADSRVRSHVRSKIMTVYFPEIFLGIHGRGKIGSILEGLGLKRDPEDRLVEGQAALVDLKKSHPVMSGWTLQDYAHFLLRAVAARREPRKAEQPVADPEAFGDSELAMVPPDQMERGIAEIGADLLVDPETVREIVINLASGRHVILAGPVGTGKTELARRIPRTFWTENEGYGAEEYTATADWDTTDVIGGIMPKMIDGKPSYRVQLGCVPSTVRKNWRDSRCRHRTSGTEGDVPHRGVWLVIDEFNRANIDEAFGQLFTSLESRRIRVPSMNDVGYEEMVIPRDYRIIGTLNTADKHHLFHLSDALKRRFAYVEVNPPPREEKQREIYHAMKNAIGQLPRDDYSSLVRIGGKSVIAGGSGSGFVDALGRAYDVLDFVRLSKPLGTAVLKSIFQTMLVAAMAKNDYHKSLDIGLRANLIPQLEGLSPVGIRAVLAVFYNSPVEFLKTIQKSESNRERHEDEFKNILQFLGLSDKHVSDLLKKFRKDQIGDREWSEIDQRDRVERLRGEPFKRALEELARSSATA